ncbi:MAG: hypothetical protein U0797_11600 [Gemmataceae bacterium]
MRGRNRAEEDLPTLLDDIRSLVGAQSQADPTPTASGSTPASSAAEVRRQPIQKGYDDLALPSEETIRRKMHQAGYSGFSAVAKCRPKKSCRRLTPSSSGWRQENAPPTPRRTRCGCRWTPRPASRSACSRGAGRVGQGGGPRPRLQGGRHADASGHPAVARGNCSCTSPSRPLTSDFIVDVVEMWWQGLWPLPQGADAADQPGQRAGELELLHAVRQPAAGLRQHEITVRLACYPPYHSKYNLSEPLLGALEQHWNGSLLDSIPTRCGSRGR